MNRPVETGGGCGLAHRSGERSDDRGMHIAIRRSLSPCTSTQDPRARGKRVDAIAVSRRHRSTGYWKLPISKKTKGLGFREPNPMIYLTFLAPRPGLEPGTYGLTDPPPNRPETRANAGFALFGCLIFPPSFAQVRPGSGWFGGRISDSSWGAGGGSVGPCKRVGRPLRRCNRSLTAAQSTLALCAIKARSVIAARSSVRTDESAPPQRPKGVRCASQMKASRVIRVPPPVRAPR
jgi:hypothetical protein